MPVVSTPDKYLGRILPRFQSPELEHAFRQHSQSEDKKRIAVVFSLYAFTLISFTCLNYLSIGPGRILTHVSVIRTAMIMVTILFWAGVLRVRDEKKFDRLLLAFWLTAAVVAYLVSSYRPAGYTATALAEVVLISFIYLLAPIGLIYKLIPCILISVISPSLWNVPPLQEASPLIFLHILAHITGSAFHIIFNRSKRIQYYLLMQDRELRTQLAGSELKYKRLIEDIEGDYYLYSHDIEGYFTYLSPSAADLVPQPVSNIIGKDWRDVFDTEPEVRQRMELADEMCRQGTVPESLEFSFNHPKKGKIIFEAQKRPVKDDSGKVIAIEGIAKNITPQKTIVDALNESRRKYRYVMDNVNVGIIVIQDNQLVFVNREVIKVVNELEHEILKNPDPYYYISAQDKSKVMESQALLVSGKKDKTIDIVTTIATDENNRWLEWTGIAVLWDQKPATLNIVKNITQTKNLENELVFINERLNKQNKMLAQAATRDTLTGIYNRSALYTYMEEQWSRSVRNEEECSVVMFDIDHFKKVNDTYGHQTGDSVIKGVANTIDKLNRPYDRLGRWGGEEFILFLPDTTMNQATAIAERLREKVAQVQFRTEDESDINVTVSIGISSKTISGTLDLEILLNHADQALYEAKTKGRNRVCAFQGADR